MTYLDNFRRYPVQQLTHFLIAVFSGLLLTGRWRAAGAVLMAAVGVRQTTEWAKLNDDVHVDMLVYIAGLLTGIVLGIRGVSAEDIIEEAEDRVRAYIERLSCKCPSHSG